MVIRRSEVQVIRGGGWLNTCHLIWPKRYCVRQELITFGKCATRRYTIHDECLPVNSMFGSKKSYHSLYLVFNGILNGSADFVTLYPENAWKYDTLTKIGRNLLNYRLFDVNNAYSLQPTTIATPQRRLVFELSSYVCLRKLHLGHKKVLVMWKVFLYCNLVGKVQYTSWFKSLQF